MKRWSVGLAAALLVGLCQAAYGQGAASAAPVTVIQNVRIFDGKGGALSAPRNVLVRGNVIERISAEAIAAEAGATATVIDGGGRTLMPGLIDMHWHTMMVRPSPAVLMTADVGYLNAVATAEAADTLMRGFTTVRDVGGPAFGLKRAIDEGVIPGPRIYPSGAIISVTSGHGDFRQPFELPRTIGSPLSRGEQIGAAMIADTPDEVRVRVREQLMQGASQIKLTAGGGVASPHSPLDATTFTEAELRAAVEAAGQLGHVRHRACVHLGIDPARHRRRREVHRARPSDGRGDCEADRGEGRLAEPAGVSARRWAMRFRPDRSSAPSSSRCSPGRTRRMRSRRSTASRPRSAPTCSSRARSRSGRVRC